MRVRRTLVETRDGHFVVARRNPRFDCDDQLLPFAGLRSGARCRSGRRIFRGPSALVAGFFGWIHRLGILAAEASHAVLHPSSQDWAGIALDLGGRGAGNDFVPTRDRRIHRRSICKMKKKALLCVGVAALFLLLASVYLWGPGA